MAIVKKFELLAGTQSNKKGNFKKGDIVESHNDLDKTFANKFQRRLDLEDKSPAKTATAAVAAAPDSSDDDKKPTNDGAPKLVKSKLGDDVTAEFPEAVEAELAVLKNKKGEYFVADSDQPDKALNKKTTDKDGVAPFIKQFLA